MSYKTDRLVDLWPDVYAAQEQSSLLYQLLDAVGAELMAADEAVKTLLKSHWVDYAEGLALDGLGAIFRVARRRLPGGDEEPDEAFRLRLKAVVPLFTGGGTRQAVLGAVRSALGLPFDLNQLTLPDPLRQDLEGLVTLIEFSPNAERLVDEITSEAEAGAITLEVPIVTVQAERPAIEWTFTRGGGRRLRLERLDTGEGVIANDALIIPEGQTLLLSTGAGNALQAFVSGVDVSGQFSSLGGGAAVLPEVPLFPSTWHFSALGALFGVSTFDQDDTFDPPRFRVEMTWQSYQPLTFDVYVPFFLKESIDRLKNIHGFTGELFVFEGLDLETIQKVIDQTRAAGVRGRVHFSLTLPLESDEGLRAEDHNQDEVFRLEGLHRIREDAAATEVFTVETGTRQTESHDVGTRFGIGGHFDQDRFDDGFVFH